MKKFFAFLSRIDSDKKAYLINLGSLILLYWPISFLVYNFKWDMADQYFPWRHHISLSLQHFEFPLWNAHQFCGYPIYADPQSGAFYPILWLLSLFGPYTLTTLHAEFLLTVFIASCGFYKLCRFFSVSFSVSILAGLMYAGSGIFIGNTQHLTWLISAAYLPWIFYCFFSLSTSLHCKYVFALSLFFYLLLSGGYPGFDIILFYLLIVFFTYYFIIHFKSGQLRKYLIVGGATILVTVLLSFAFLYSVYSLSPYTSRGGGVSLEAALQNAFTPASFISFLLPFATCRHSDILGTDISMANAYFGIFFLLCLPLYFTKTKKTTLEKIILALAVVCLLTSVGEVLPFRTWLFHLPLMNYFRFPSAFRIFVVLFFLLLSAIQIDKQKEDRSSFRFILWPAILIFIAIIFIAIKKNYSGTGISDFFSNRSFYNEHSTIFDHILLQSIVQLVLLSLFCLVTFFYKKHFTRILYCFLIVDLYASVHLNLPYTSLDFGSSPIVLQEKLSQQPGFPHIPTNKIILNNDEDQRLKPLWKNLHNHFREIAYDGYNPFSLKQYDSLVEHKYYQKLLQNTPVYLAEKYLDRSKTNYSDSAFTDKIVLLESSYLPEYNKRKSTPGDSYKITSFTGNTITVKCFVADTSTLVIFQNLVPGWQCKVNQKEQAIEPVNISLMGIKLSPGKSTVLLEYKPKGIYFLLWFTICTFVIVTSVLIFNISKKYFSHS